VSIFEEAKGVKTGAVSTQFPLMANVDPELFSLGVCTVDGNVFSFGDNVHFTLQNISWVFIHSISLEEHGENKLNSYVGNEPSQAPPFAFVLNNAKKPHNPFINSGALVVSSLIHSKKDPVYRIQGVLEQLSAMSSKRLACSMPAYISMSGGSLEASDRDIALAYWLRSAGTLGKETDVKKVLDFFFQICTVEGNTSSVAALGATLANEGVEPHSGKKCVDPRNAKSTVSLLSTCGMNEGTKEWNDLVGITAKCAVSGGLLLIIPKVMGMCIFSPRLDQKGITTRGMEFSKLLVQKFPAIKTFKF